MTGRWFLLSVAVITSVLTGSVQAADPPADPYPDHSRLMVYVDDSGALQPVKSPQDWTRRRADILKGMQAAMGPLPQPVQWPAFDLQETEELSGDGFVRKTYTFAVEFRGDPAKAAVDRLSIDLYLPQPLPEGDRRAAILALHPTGAAGKRIVAGEGKENRQYAVELAQRGYVVLAPDYPSFGDAREYDFAADEYVSGTMKGIVNHRRCVDLLQSLPQVDPARIGVIGHSLGGHNAMFAAAFDERIRAIVSSCGWDPFHFYYGGKLAGWTSDRYMPRLRDVYGLDPDKVPFDFYEVVAALAPRPFLSCSPVGDSNFQVAGVEKAIDRAKEVYALLGARDALQLRTPKCGHDFPTEMRLEAYAFLDRVLGHTPARTIDYASELPRIPPLDPTAALKSFELVPGVEIQQTASEPVVVDPVAICFDARGGLFVIEMRDYSEQDQEQLGRVRRLVDTDGDGRFDDSVVFAENLSWPTAIASYDDGVFVGAPPHLYYLKDTDGDGRADVRRTVFTGFSRANVQGMMNSFHWGLDNRLHGATGTAGGVVTRPDDPNFKPVDLRGRDFSFDPRTLDLRPESGGAQHGMCFDDWGRKFVSSNSDHCQQVMYEDRYIARNRDFPAPGPRVSIAEDGPQAPVFRISPVEPWRIVRTRLRASGVVSGVVEGGGQPAGYFTGATGITIYRGNSLPDLRGLAIVGDVGSNLVHRKRLTARGIEFVASRVDPGTEFVRSRDIWFRPVQFANGPDGCLHILDMYREVIEHPKSLPPEIKQHLDLTSGRDRGRLYRVTSPGFTGQVVIDLSRASSQELVALLAHPNAWQRETASRLLYERSDPAADAALMAQLRESAAPLGRLHALYALQSRGQLTAELTAVALQDAEPMVRVHAVRLAEGWLSSSTIRDLLVGLKTDPDLRVRYQLAFSAGELRVDERVPVLSAILRQDGSDRWVRTAALSSLAEGAGAVLADLLTDAGFVRQAAAINVVSPLARLVGRQNRQADLSLVFAALQQPEAASVAPRVLLELAQGNPKLRSQLAGSPQGAALESLLAQARRKIADAAGEPAQRAAALELLRLTSWSEDGELLAAALDHRQPVDVQRAAVAVLGTYTDPAALDLILSQWARLGPVVRRDAEEVVSARPAGVASLLARLESGEIRPTDLSPGRLQLLQSHKDPQIKSRVTALLAQFETTSRQEVIDRYQSALTMAGDVERGRALFRRTCAACHKLEGVGVDLAPNLASMKNRGPEAILVNVLDPNREVNPQFQSYLIITSDGLTHSGIVQSESGSALTLIRNEGKTETILRSEIEDLRSTGLSLMPEGLEKDIDVQGLADLLAYLQRVE